MNPNQYKILVVDDSKLIRRTISRIFESENNFVVAGEAENGKEALKQIPLLDPDVVTLDINMPVMDGLTALKHIMIKSPKPTVMLSSLTSEGATITFDALKYGAVDFIQKPSRLSENSREEQSRSLVQKVVMAANVRIDTLQFIRSRPVDKAGTKSDGLDCRNLVAIGSGEGGYASLLKIVPRLDPGARSAYVVCIYAASEHVRAFAKYLNEHSEIEVKVAHSSEPVRGGVCYISPGNQYVTVEPKNGRFNLKVNPAPFESRKGSINMLMFSAAEMFNNRCIGVILSGSGEDGSEGLTEIIRLGGFSIVQDPDTCLCKEMTMSALEACRVHRVVANGGIAGEINQFLL